MALGVRLEENDGTVVAEYDHRHRIGDTWVDLWIESILPAPRDPAFPLLGNLDPYDDTIFNGWQAELLTQELGRLDVEPNDLERRESIRRLRDLCASCERMPHRRLRFVGD
jgi:hypothetical protein